MNDQNTSPTSDTAEFHAFFLEFNSVWNEHKFDQIGNYYAESFILNGVQRDPRSLYAQVKTLTTTFPDWHWGVGHVVVEGNLICVRYTITGTHRGVYDGIEPTGRKFSVLELGHYRVVGGRFVESWFVYDDVDLKRQLTQP